MTAPRTPAAILRAAAALVRRGWTQRTDARDEDGRDVQPFDSDAVRWCAVGALVAAAHAPVPPGRVDFDFHAHVARQRAEAELASVCGVDDHPGGASCGLSAWNDEFDTTAEDVALAMEQAAAGLEATGKAP